MHEGQMSIFSNHFHFAYMTRVYFFSCLRIIFPSLLIFPILHSCCPSLPPLPLISTFLSASLLPSLSFLPHLTSSVLTHGFRFDLQCEVFQESNVAELVSAMAGGWNPQLILKAWHREGIVPDEQSRSEYVDAMREAGMSPEAIVGEAEEVMEALGF
uniref:Uncharacterized protein n=1 Tax=Nelumbo nucifera TaxID=4432 RepID=A0A822XJN7_NELNU|nr:TPA_asm: hypothetical protein HUJ06_021960 [Nelumbo nucifera]